MRGPDRLASILWGEQLRTFVPYSGRDPAVSFTEAMLEGIKFMIQQQGYAPWGVAFDKQSVYNAGGGPVWYPRLPQHQRLLQLDPSLLSWAVLLEAPDYDWHWEREWRIVRPSASGQSVVALSELRMAALLVGDPSWNGVRYEYRVAADTGQPRWDHFFQRIPSGLQRWWWNGTELQLLRPLF
jgi:hypothetical protein